MKKFILLYSIAFSSSFFAQTFIQSYQNRVNQISQTNINTYLTEFADLGVKKTGSVNNNNAFNWLKSKYISFGYSEDQLSENAFIYQGNTAKNLILTKTGTKYPDTYVIVCGHYDTIVGPGVNDNGSGTSILLEMARILKEIPTEYSIKFINFTGEEQGLLGSQNYVQTVVNATSPKMNIKLVFNIDEVGGVAGKTNDTIICEKDTSSPTSNNAASATITQQLMNCVVLYSPLQTKLSNAYSSDYMPFQANNEVITGFFEFNESTKPHSAADTYVNMDPVYVYNVGKAALGAVQHFANADTTDLSTADCPPEKMLESLKIFPNPAKDFLQIEMMNYNLKDFSFMVTDLNGRTLIQTKNEKQINISKLSSGIYLGTMTVEDQKLTKKIMIKK
ncbi:M28 family peptidase [Chryseobacterium gotjawalense]|uniref:M28 family peptidase n=1 Tax=Chryseobacterium gotjawalense TaxID=3042315 RepID=A0ABY8RF42_9FLAO|nr:M28 family peptidase [Chryseobacterium sp. wdc7]WHF52570.1 M28 family peptidase [Chryseobacterium sp. wdc7]